MAAQGELEREQNSRQVRQKMKARVESGFWVSRAPVGYKYEPAKSGGGKVLVPVEPVASSVRQALEGYATGRSASQAEVQHFLEQDPFFPKDRPDGSIRSMTVTRLLKKPVYAGYVYSTKSKISLREGKHPGLISFEMHEQILETLEGKKRAPARKDFNEDFPLRGFVLCDSCGKRMTAAWSTGCRQRYAYYRCATRGCQARGKSVRRASLEGSLEKILEAMQPSNDLAELAKAMISDAWDAKTAEAQRVKLEWARQLKDTEKQIDDLLDRAVDATNSSARVAYEERVAKLDRRKFVLREK